MSNNYFFKVNRGLKLNSADAPASLQEGQVFLDKSDNKIKTVGEVLKVINPVSTNVSVEISPVQNAYGTGSYSSISTIDSDGFIYSGNPLSTEQGHLFFVHGYSVLDVGYGVVSINPPDGIGNSTLQFNFDNTGAGTINLSPIAAATSGNYNLYLPAASDTLVGLNTSDILTNKTISGTSNTISNIGNSSLTNSSITINGSSVSLGNSTTITASTTNALTIGTGLSGTSFNGSTAVTIAIDSSVVTLNDSQILTNKTISGSNNTLSNIGNSSLTNSSITINGSSVSLGGSTTVTASTTNALTIGDGLTGTSFNGSSAITIAFDSRDSIFKVVDATDITKQFKIDVAGFTGTSTTILTSQTSNVILTLPNATDTLIGLNTSDILTNKTISGLTNTLSNIGNSSLVNSSVTINGSSVSLGGSTTITANTTNALTIGTGLTGTSFNGSGAVTIAIDSSVVTLTGTQALTNKSIDDALSFKMQASTPSNAATNYYKFYVKTDGNFYKLDNLGNETQIGSGGGGGTGLASSGKLVPSGYPLTLVSSDNGKVVLIDTTSARTVNLPAPVNGWSIIIKDISGQALTNNITLVRSGSEKIEGQSSDYTCNVNYGCWTLFCDGTDYILI